MCDVNSKGPSLDSCGTPDSAHLDEYVLSPIMRGTQRQFLENICSEDDLRSRIFATFVVKCLACLPLLGF